ncbi:MAG: glycosyltransferase [Verrucomicrobia bacterium]|nr:glycosyltransferase [Verrucomicrobiota bacterium]
MKKVLLVSPHFPPINAPDMQRVRLALPHLRDRGWEPSVLAVAPEMVEGGVREPRLEETYPGEVPVVRVRGVRAESTRWAGIGNLWWRCGHALRRAGDDWLRREAFDVVLFSTTVFSAWNLGPRWRQARGVPYVLDYQDPWVSDYYARTGTRPPGGRLRFALSQWVARRDEPPVLRQASGVIAVSDTYAAMLARLYPWFDASAVKVLPFGAAEADLVVAARHRPSHPLINFEDGHQHLVYTGRCGPDMVEALTILFRAFRLYRRSHRAEAARLRFHFIGTGYAPPPGGEDTVLPVAAAEGVADAVREHRHRVPYFDALHYLQRAQALVAVGSNDRTYSASKIFPYLLARRPMLLIYHADSLVQKVAAEMRLHGRFAFQGAAGIEEAAARVHAAWFVPRAYEEASSFDAAAFAPYTAAAMTATLADVLDAATRRT